MTGIKQAVILAGGLGTRLRPLTNDRPKPMVEIAGKPFLEHLVELLKANGIEEIVMLLGYMPEKITEYFGDGAKFGIKIKYSIGDVDWETGTRIKKAEKLLNNRFLLMYSDNYWPLDLAKLSAFHESAGLSATVTVYSNKDKFTRNNLKLINGLVEYYDPSRLKTDLNGVDIGFFILEKSILDLMPDSNFSFEKEILPALVADQNLSGFMTNHKYYSIGSLERLPITEEFLKPKKIIFLDRDGVINAKPKNADYVKSWGEFKFLPGAIEALQIFTKKGYQLYIVTNQAGIGRGIMSESDLASIHERLISELTAYGIWLSGVYYCPHNWDAGCECRKPNPGMFFSAAAENHIDLSKSFFIGDDECDLQAGESAGVKTYLVGAGGLLDAIRINKL